jgi:hypothetical protein
VVEASKKTPINLDSLARCYTERAIQVLGGLIETGETDAVKVAACAQLLDRGWGRPKQDNSHEVKGEIKVVLRKMLEDDDDA